MLAPAAGEGSMDHAEVVELIELAAVEPEGLARLAAGDTPEAAAIAGHLAGCDACTSELRRTARAATLARQAIRELPDPALRERTLAYVREVGRDRTVTAASAHVVAAERAAATSAAAPSPETVSPEAPHSPAAVLTPFTRRRPSRGWWAAASVAAVLVASVAGFVVGGAARPAAPGDDGGASLAVAQTTMRIAQQADVVRVVLAPAGSGQGSGALVYSAASGELAMTVTGLAPIPAGATYACWVEQAGQRRRIGVLYMEGTDGTWAGTVSGLADLTPGSTFGVSLVPAGAAAGTPVLLGTS